MPSPESVRDARGALLQKHPNKKDHNNNTKYQINLHDIAHCKSPLNLFGLGKPLSKTSFLKQHRRSCHSLKELSIKNVAIIMM
jgi:hypothetical protein